jgi:hypothetical protein
MYDESVSVGGPVQRDRIWFFGALRTWGFSRQIAGGYWNKTQNVPPRGSDQHHAVLHAVPSHRSRQ